MKKKQVLAVSSALMIGTATALTGIPAPVMAEEQTEVVQEAAADENKTEQVPVEQETENEKEVVTEDENVAESKTTEGKVGSIAIEETNFPDKVFRDYVLLTADSDNDYVLSEKECSDITSIMIDGTVGEYTNLTSLKGIEYFPNITKLYCTLTNLSDVDITKNTKLKEVKLYKAPIKQLDVSKNTELEVLTMEETLISDIDVRNNPKLRFLDCQHTNVSNLDVSQNLELDDLACAYTAIETLNIQNNIKLQDLYIHNTKIQDIYIIRKYKK